MLGVEIIAASHMITLVLFRMTKGNGIKISYCGFLLLLHSKCFCICHCSFRIPHLDISVLSPEHTNMESTLYNIIENWDNRLKMPTSGKEEVPCH